MLKSGNIQSGKVKILGREETSEEHHIPNCKTRIMHSPDFSALDIGLFM